MIKKYFLAVVMFFALLIVCCSCDALGLSDLISGIGNAPEVSEAGLYDAICDMADGYAKEFRFRNTTVSAVEKAYNSVFDEHPEYFWLSGDYSVSQRTSGLGSVTVLTPVPYTGGDDIAGMKAELDRCVDSYMSDISGCDSQYDKLRVIYSRLTSETAYDEQAFSSDGSGSRSLSNTAYGSLVLHKAACSGYSTAFQLLARKAGVDCGRIHGLSLRGVTHEWNYVKLDGDYYYVDATWGTSVTENGVKSETTYEFFLITTEELEKTHYIDNGDRFVPECDTVKYDYYKLNGLYIETYDFDTVAAIVSEHIEEGRVELKFSSREEFERAVEDLFGDDEKVFTIPGTGNGIFYSAGGSGQVMCLIFSD